MAASKNYIDISIKSADKVLKDKRKLLTFLENHTRVELKLDGVKVQIIVKKDADPTKPYYENFIVAYKGNVLWPEEFDYNDDEEAKASIGSSQYKFIWDTLKQADITKLPKGYQFFCEYLIKKPTLMSQYTNLYNLILLAYGPCNYKIENGMLITDNSDFDFDLDERIQYAKALGIQVPPEVFEGVLYPTDNLIKGIKYDQILQNVKNKENEFKNAETDIELYWKLVNNSFLEVKDPFGGKPEGYVFWTDGFPPLKIQQEYQLSKEERAKVKAQYKEDNPLIEATYWAQVKKLAEDLVAQIPIKSKDNVDMRSALAKLAQLIKKLPENVITHSKKNWATIKDDIFLTAKLMLIRRLAKKYALVIGKFRVLTNGHIKMIRKALEKYAGVVIAVTINKETKRTLDLRIGALERCFKKEIKSGQVKIIPVRTGNLATIINKALPIIIGGVVAGSDRVPGYQEQIQKLGQDLHIIEIPRDESAISATKVIQNLDNEAYFKRNTPKCVWDLYPQYLKVYKGDE